MNIEFGIESKCDVVVFKKTRQGELQLEKTRLLDFSIRWVMCRVVVVVFTDFLIVVGSYRIRAPCV